MKALRIHAPNSTLGISLDDVPMPEVAPGQVLIQVYASGISPMEINWATSTGQLRPLPAILGFEFSGVVAALGENVKDLTVGSTVYGMPNFKSGGSQAEYIAVQAEEIALKPISSSHLEASGVPLSALTAWQALFEQADIKPGQAILIHGAAGGVGTFAVQLAKWAGARVIVTASENNHSFLASLGADEVIDYTHSAFEEAVRDVDVVLDLVGGDTLNRSWSVLKKGGSLISIANVTVEELQASAAKWGVRANWFLVRPSSEQLTHLAKLIDSGQLKPQIGKIFPLSQGRKAYEEGIIGHNRGKLILEVFNNVPA